MKAGRNGARQAIQLHWCHPKKRHFLPRIHHKALCMTSDLVCTECGLESIFEALAEPLHTHNSSVCYKSTKLSKPERLVCVCIHCQDLRCVFKCPPESERVKRDPNGKIQAEYWGVDCGVKWHIYQNSESLPKPHLLQWLIMRERGKLERERETGPKIFCSGTYKDTKHRMIQFVITLFYDCVTQQNWHCRDSDI